MSGSDFELIDEDSLWDEVSAGEMSDEEECTDEEVDEPPKKRRRTVNRTWLKDNEFETGAEAEKAVDAVWKKCSKTNTAEGLRVDYQCTKGAYRVNECPAGLYLLYHSTSLKVTLFRTAAQHANHLSVPRRGLSEELKQFIALKFEEGIRKPNAILALLRDKKLLEPQKSKICTYLRMLRLAKYGPTSISAQDIRDWCHGHRTIPEDEDTPFVLQYLVQSNVDEEALNIVLSTRRLLSNVPKSNLVQCDGTHKLNWEGFPVLLVGASDSNQKFHPFAIAVSRGETTDDFAYIFDALKQYHGMWKPRILIADSAEAITNGFVKVFGDPEIRINCFFHVRENVEKYIKALSKEGNKELPGDLTALQLAKDDETFEKASALFMDKWSAVHPTFAKYFHTQWLQKNSKWYEGAAVTLPSTNNGLEATNRVIKDENTLRERLPVGQFLNGVFAILEKWSKDRAPESPNYIPFAECPTLSLQKWTEAYQWAGLKKPMLERPHADPNCRVYYVPSSTMTKPFTRTYLTKILKAEHKWSSFKQYKLFTSSAWAVKIDSGNLSSSSCTCPPYLKRGHCKHVLGVKIRLELVTVPPQAKDVPIGQKRKRGRPKKATRALIRD